MKAIVTFGLFVLLGTLARAQAADLPKLDGQYCQTFLIEHPAVASADPTFKDRCMSNMEGPIKAAILQIIERNNPSKALIQFCTVDANYRGNGFLSFLQCLTNEIAAKYFATYHLDAWGTYCTLTIAGSGSGLSRCRESEATSRLLLPAAMVEASPEAIYRCVSNVSPRSFSVLLDCVRERPRASR